MSLLLSGEPPLDGAAGALVMLEGLLGGVDGYGGGVGIGEEYGSTRHERHGDEPTPAGMDRDEIERMLDGLLAADETDEADEPAYALRDGAGALTTLGDRALEGAEKAGPAGREQPPAVEPESKSGLAATALGTEEVSGRPAATVDVAGSAVAGDPLAALALASTESDEDEDQDQDQGEDVQADADYRADEDDDDEEDEEDEDDDGGDAASEDDAAEAASGDGAGLADFDEDAYEEQREANTARFRTTLEAIMQHYDQPFDDDDEVDIHTLEVVTDRGFLRSLGAAAAFGAPALDETTAVDPAADLDAPPASAAEATPHPSARPGDSLWIDSCTPDEEYALDSPRRRRRRRQSAAAAASADADGSLASPPKAPRHGPGDRTPPPRSPAASATLLGEVSPCDGPGGCRRLFCLSCGGAYGR